jgi:DnaK suppressor protein
MDSVGAAWTLWKGLISFMALPFLRGRMPLTKKQLSHLEKRLLDERERALKALGLFDRMTKADRESGDSDLAAYTDHMADQGTEAMEREKAAIFATKEGRYLYRLEEALRRLYDDPRRFGTCHTCGSDVGFERLDALPHARYCIDCKRKEEDSAA